MPTPPLADVPIRSAEELTRRWEVLLDPPIFGARSLWLTWLDDGLMLPVVVPIDDVPSLPDGALLLHLATVCASVAGTRVSGACHVAMALCRPGRPAVTAADEEWVHDLAPALASLGATWSFHLAAGGTVTPLVDLTT